MGGAGNRFMDYEAVYQVLGYRFRDAKLLTSALTHASIAGHRLESNERLEFLGDAVLGFVVSEYLFLNFPNDLEGQMTKIKSAVVSRKICATIASGLGLGAMLNLGKGMSGRPNLPTSISAAALESIIAAIYLDGGTEPARQFILQHLTPIIDELVESAHQHNFKSVLQQYAQKCMPGTPEYLVLDEKGPDHSKCFEVCAVIHGQRFTSAWANSKKEAEQKAALLALCELELAVVDETGRVRLHQSLVEKNSVRRSTPPADLHLEQPGTQLPSPTPE
jgi:ribonuclease III